MSVDQKASIRSILEVLAQERIKDRQCLAKQIPAIGEKSFRNSGQKGWFFIVLRYSVKAHKLSNCRRRTYPLTRLQKYQRYSRACDNGFNREI